MATETGFKLGLVRRGVLLRHQLNPHIPELAPGDLDRTAPVQIDGQQAVGDLGGQPRQHIVKVMARWRDQWLPCTGKALAEEEGVAGPAAPFGVGEIAAACC